VIDEAAMPSIGQWREAELGMDRSGCGRALGLALRGRTRLSA